MRVVLDTNALLMPFEYGINIDLELKRILGDAEIYVPSCVVGEIERLARKRWEAKAALQLIKKYRICPTSLQGDDGVMECGEKLKAFVVTNDQTLQKRLKSKGIKVIYLSNYHLVIGDD